MGWTTMNMSMLQNICDLDLKDALLKSSKDMEARNSKEISDLKQDLSKAEDDLAEEKKKNTDFSTRFRN
jgi:predicted  nucleic acid-binding Zn ribbon protein